MSQGWVLMPPLGIHFWGVTHREVNVMYRVHNHMIHPWWWCVLKQQSYHTSPILRKAHCGHLFKLHCEEESPVFTDKHLIYFKKNSKSSGLSINARRKRERENMWPLMSAERVIKCRSLRYLALSWTLISPAVVVQLRPPTQKYWQLINI